MATRRSLWFIAVAVGAFVGALGVSAHRPHHPLRRTPPQ